MSGARTYPRLAALFVAAFAIVWPALAQAQDADAARDRGILQAFLEDNLSAAGRDVRIEGFQGALSGRATIDTLTIADADGVWLTLRDAVLDWNRAALLSGRLDVTELSARELVIPRAPASDPAPPEPTAGTGFALPDLPVAIDIETLELDRVILGAPLIGQDVTLEIAGNASLAGGEGAAELRLERMDGPAGLIVLDGAYGNESRQLALQLRVEEGPGGLAATALDLPGRPALLLEISGDDPIDDFRADIRLATDGVDRLSGSVTLGTDQPATDATGPTRWITAELSGDIAPVFAPQYRAFFGPDIALELRAALPPSGRRVLETLRLRARAVDLVGNGAIAADGWPERLDLTGRIAEPQGGPVRMPLGDGGTQVDLADINLRYDRATGDRWQLRADVQGLSQPDGTRLGSVVLTGDGSLAAPDTDRSGAVDGRVALRIAGLALSDGELSGAIGSDLSGQLSFDWMPNAPLRLRNIDLSGADYGVTGATTLRLPSDALDLLATLDLSLAANDLSRFAALAGVDLQGMARLDIAGDIAPVSTALDLTLGGETTDLAIGQPRLDPLLAGTGTLNLRARRDTEATRIDDLTIETAHARITGDALLGVANGRFTLQADIPQTARIDPNLSGAARLSAQGNGTQSAWDLQAEADLPGDTGLSWQGRITGLDGAPRLEGVARLASNSLAPYGTLAGRRISGGLTAQADLDILLETLSGRLDLQATSRDLAVGVPLADQILRGSAEVSALLRRDAAGRLTIDNARVTTPVLQAQIDGETAADSQNLRAELTLRDGSLLAPELAGPVRIAGNARRASGDWQLDITGSAAGGTTIAARGSLAPDARRADLGLSGRLPLALLNPRLRPRAISGTANYDLRLSGPLALQSLSGQVTAADARLTLPSLGLALENIDARIGLGGGRARVDTTASVSSGGRLTLGGNLDLATPFNADLQVRAQEVGLRQARLYETTATGEVTLSGPLTGGARIAGLIDLGPAELRVPSTSGASFAALPGLRHVNEPPEVRRVRQWAGLVEQPGAGAGGGGPAYPVDLTIRAPSRIFVRGRGLDAELGGQLRLLGTTAALVPQGRFELVRGRLDILGQRLMLDEGLLQLQGSFDPYIRFSATTQAQDVGITLAIEGLASNPELVLASSPELPQDEILSQLLFGRDLTEISALQALRLANALATLSGRGGIGVAARLRNSLSLDDLDVTTDSEGNVEASAGKYLSENIYSDVTVNGAGESEINLNLEVSPSLTVRGRLRSDGDTGVGVYFERDY